MSNWYYFDNNGKKQGPITGGQLKWLTKNGHISPETIVETEDGKLVPAKKVNDLIFTGMPPRKEDNAPPISETPIADKRVERDRIANGHHKTDFIRAIRADLQCFILFCKELLNAFRVTLNKIEFQSQTYPVLIDGWKRLCIFCQPYLRSLLIKLNKNRVLSVGAGCILLFLVIRGCFWNEPNPKYKFAPSSPSPAYDSAPSQPSQYENHLEENIQIIQDRAKIEEQLERAWNTYRRTNDSQLRMILEENKNLGYVINGRPLREWLDLYPHRPD